MQVKAAEREGKRRLKAAVAQHSSWDPRSPTMQAVRFADDVEPGLGLTISQVGHSATAPGVHIWGRLSARLLTLQVLGMLRLQLLGCLLNVLI